MAFHPSFSAKDIGEAPVLVKLPREDPEESPVFKTGVECWVCQWSPDNSLFAWSCGRRLIKLVPTDILLSHGDVDVAAVTIDAGYLVWSLAFSSYSNDVVQQQSINNRYRRFQSHDTLLLAAGLSNGHIRVWDIHSGKMVFELMDHTDVVRDLKFAPDGSLLLVSASRDCSLKVWDMPDDGNMIATLKTCSSYQARHWVFCCSWSPDAVLLASVGASKNVTLWDMKTKKFLKLLKGHHHDVVSCQFANTGEFLATASFDTTVILWDHVNGNKIVTLGHMFPAPSIYFMGGTNDTFVRSVSISPDGLHVTTVAEDNLVRIWNLEETRIPEKVGSVRKGISSAFNNDGTMVAVGTRLGGVSFFSCEKTVKSLSHICRMKILTHFKTGVSFNDLSLPHNLRNYLKFYDAC